jgi:hypothetical protein
VNAIHIDLTAIDEFLEAHPGLDLSLEQLNHLALSRTLSREQQWDMENDEAR